MTAQALTRWSFDLSGRTVQVWCVRTDAPGTVAEQFAVHLGSDEKNRAARYRTDHQRHSFIIGRGVLRVLIGRYLNISPVSVQFDYGARGKPALAAPAGFDFSVSNSAGLAVYAFMIDGTVGVDVEQIRALPNMQRIADRFFCAEEAAELMSLPANQRERSFYLCWTRKEAYIKAIGDGLSVPLDSFRVTLQPGQPVRFIHLESTTSVPEAWTLHDLQLTPDYAAALAYRDKQRPVTVLPVIDAAELLNI